jgi:phospholipid/cholesterol/gamma-HCH transport system substrate-binding protein
VEAKVGVFVVIVLIGLAYLTTQINRSGFSFKRYKTINMIFSNATGILPRSAVELAGIRVGMVDEIKLVNGKALVVTKLEENVPLFEDSVVALKSRGILGEKVISISGGGALPEVPNGGTVNAYSSSGDFDSAMQNFNEIAEVIKDFLKGGDGKPSLQDVMGNMADVTEDLKFLIQSNRQDLNEIVKNIHGFSKTMNSEDLKSIVENLRTSSEMIKSFVETADPKLNDVVNDFSGVMAKINQTVDSLNRVVAKVDRGEGTLGKLLNDETTVNKVNDTLDGISDFVGRVRKLEIAVGYRGEYLSSVGEVQSVASFRIQPNFDKYFLFEFTNGPLELSPISSEITTRTETEGGVTTTRTIRKDRTDDAFMFTLLLARRFWDLTLKAGMIRSTGGFGAEYHLFRDHLSIGIDAFDFGRETRPHLRAYAMLHLWKIFKITGGVDDMITKTGRRNYFGGFGLMLTDSDLKSLFTLAPLASGL